MVARNRRTADNMSDDIEHLSERGEQAGHRMAESITERMPMAALAAFDAFNGPFARVMDQNRLMFQKMLHAMQEESLRFVNRRLEHTGRAIESCRDCQGVVGLVAAQHEFLVEMARDYAEQTRRFAELVREVTEDGASSMTEAAASGASEAVRAAARRADVRAEPESRAAA